MVLIVIRQIHRHLHPHCGLDPSGSASRALQNVIIGDGQRGMTQAKNWQYKFD